MNIVRQIANVRPVADETPVLLKTSGNIVEIKYMRSTPSAPIRKLDKHHGLDLRTGEVIEYKHNASRATDKASVAQSLRKLRDLINTNLTDPETALWVTLTYAENMKDPVRLYEDYRRFWQRFRYYLQKQNFPGAEYITAAEPQARGAWHLHGLFFFPGKAPFIPNADIAKLWGHGFTKTKSLRGIDNPGLYLTAYLGDMELSEAISIGKTHGRITEVDSADELGTRKRKAVIKGARLNLYPSGFNLYRCSRGVKRPQVYQVTEAEAMEIVGAAPLTYEKTVSITDGAGEVRNIINYRQYNKARKIEDE